MLYTRTYFQADRSSIGAQYQRQPAKRLPLPVSGVSCGTWFKSFRRSDGLGLTKMSAVRHRRHPRLQAMPLASLSKVRSRSRWYKLIGESIKRLGKLSGKPIKRRGMQLGHYKVNGHNIIFVCGHFPLHAENERNGSLPDSKTACLQVVRGGLQGC